MGSMLYRLRAAALPLAGLLAGGCGMNLSSGFNMPALSKSEQSATGSRIAGYNRSALGNKPAAAAAGVDRLPNGRGMIVEVGPGETLLDISRRTKVPVSLLMSENRLSDLTVSAGQKLFVPKL